MKKTLALFLLLAAPSLAHAAPIQELECKGKGMHQGKPASFYVVLNQEDGFKVGEKTDDGMESDSDEMPFEKVQQWEEKGRSIVGYKGGLRITVVNSVEATLVRPKGWGTSDPKGETVHLLCSILQ